MMPSFSNGDQVLRWFEDKVRKLTDESKDVLRDGAREGADLTRQYIETRGTEKSGKAGRIETGRMLGAVDDEVQRDTETEYEVAFGWLRDRANYFQFQELGTEAIEPMYALSDAADQVIADVNKRIRGAIRDV